MTGSIQASCIWRKTLGAVVDSHSAKSFIISSPKDPGYQNAAAPRISWPVTVSQVLPGAGGIFHGHLANPLLPALDPKSLPSRSGFTFRLTIVPGFILPAFIPCPAPAAAPAISTP